MPMLYNSCTGISKLWVQLHYAIAKLCIRNWPHLIVIYIRSGRKTQPDPVLAFVICLLVLPDHPGDDGHQRFDPEEAQESTVDLADAVQMTGLNSRLFTIHASIHLSLEARPLTPKARLLQGQVGNVCTYRGVLNGERSDNALEQTDGQDRKGKRRQDKQNSGNDMFVESIKAGQYNGATKRKRTNERYKLIPGYSTQNCPNIHPKERAKKASIHPIQASIQVSTSPPIHPPS